MPLGTEVIKHIERLGADKVYAVSIWMVDDVLSVAAERGIGITEAEAEEILERVHQRHDAEYGINWDVLRGFLPDQEPELEWLRLEHGWCFWSGSA